MRIRYLECVDAWALVNGAVLVAVDGRRTWASRGALVRACVVAGYWVCGEVARA